VTWVVPVALEDAVRAAAREVVGDAALADAKLARAIEDRSRRYTSERDKLARPSDAKADLAARAAFFTIADAIKIAIPIAELRNRNALPVHAPLRVVDLGAGCGALALGLAAALPELARDVAGAAPGRAVELLAIDRDSDALRVAKRALAIFAPRFAVTTRVADLASAALPPADLVLAGTVLNELPAAAREPLALRALAAIPDDGAVILIEPALRETARALHELRDQLIARGAHVFAPCTRAIAPCPALADPDDWCHEDRLVELPPRTAQLARATHLRDGGLKFAYLVLRKTPLPLVEQTPAWRLVSEPRAQKGKLEIFGCSDAGRIPIRLLTRHRTSSNRDFERGRRGEVVVTEAKSDGERVEITAADTVERIDPVR
jgi:ribosomal protein RSM22 (predicted rRNA methylase)